MAQDQSPFRKDVSYHENVAAIAAAIKSPSDSYHRYTDAYDAARSAEDEYWVAANKSYGGSYRNLVEKRHGYERRSLLGRIFHRAERQEVEEALADSQSAATATESARRIRDDASVYKTTVETAARMHYEQNRDAYHTEALGDAALAGVHINRDK